MKRADLYGVVDTLLCDAARMLAENYTCYYPKTGGSDPNERDITTAFAIAARMQGLNWPTFTEVPVKQGKYGNQEDRIDMLMLPKSGNGDSSKSVILIESKNIFAQKQFSQIESDFLKMNRFSGRRLQDGTDFPSNRLHLTLMMDWSSKDALSAKLSHLHRETSHVEETSILKMIRPREFTNYLDLDQWLVGLCRWHGAWD